MSKSAPDLVILRNDYGWLITKDNSVRDKLWQVLRFRQRNYYHTAMYRQGLWDGFVDFFSKTSGRFLAGLWPEIAGALKQLGRSYQIQDERSTVGFTVPHVNADWLGGGVVLEDYQVDFINQAIKHQRGIIKAPTGSGKTFAMVGILKALPPDTPTLLLCNRKTLVRQNFLELQKWNIPHVGYLDSTKHKPDIITCASVQSTHHIESSLPQIRALIVDEVHLLMTPTAIGVYKALRNCGTRIAVSATPFKFGEKDLVQKFQTKGHFGPLFRTGATPSGQLTTAELQERGRLSRSRCTFLYIKKPELPFHLYMDAVTEGIAENDYFLELVSDLARSCKGRTLILVERIEEGDRLHRLLPDSLWVQGKDNHETRDFVIGELQKATQDRVAISTRILDVGVNFFVHTLINAAGGKSAHDVIQRFGRGLRPAQDKKGLRYYDFYFTINQYLEDHSRQRIRTLKQEGHPVDLCEPTEFCRQAA